MGGFGRSHGGVSSRTSESSRTHSSEVSADDEGTIPIMDYPGREHSCTEWTDEKHRLYLKSMEASFVDQLYSSLGHIESKSDRNASNFKSSRRMYHDTEPHSGRFTVLQGGFWEGINFRRDESQTNRRDKTLAHRRLMSHPLEKSYELESQVISSSNEKEGKLIETSCTMREHDVSSCREEVSDQNFVDEEIKGKRRSMSKRKKFASNEPDDQVVPHGQRPAMVLENHALG